MVVAVAVTVAADVVVAVAVPDGSCFCDSGCDSGCCDSGCCDSGCCCAA